MKPTIELRKVSHSKSLSEETPAYTADVYVDGQLFCHASNHGQGGCDSYHAPKGSTGANIYDRIKELDERIKATFESHDVSYMYRDGQKHTLDQSLELICHTLLDDIDLQKTVKRDLAKKIMWVSPKDGKIYQVKLAHPSHRDPAITAVKAKHGVERTLNEMTLDEAVAVYKTAA